MAILTIGRVGLDVEFPHPSGMTESRSVDSREFTLNGYVRSSSITYTKYLRNELLEQQGQIVACTYTGDTHFDAFYLLADVGISSIEASYMGTGLFEFEVSLFRIGGSARVELQSNLTGTVIDNEIGLLESEVKPFVAPPVDSDVFAWGVNGLGAFNRETEDGTITVYTSTGDFSADATWGCLPAQFYEGAAKILTSDRVRMGLDIPQSPDDWELNNGIIKVYPDTSTNKIAMTVWDGVSAYESEMIWEPLIGGANISSWSFVSAVRNDPECVILRLVSGGTLARHTIDLQLRRGSPQLFVNWYWGGVGATLKMVLTSAVAGTDITPTGASGVAGVRATSDDTNGHRYTIFSPTASITTDTTNGGVSVASANRLNTSLGFEVDGTSAISGNTADDLALQYFGMVGERVRAVWR